MIDEVIGAARAIEAIRAEVCAPPHWSWWVYCNAADALALALLRWLVAPTC